MNEMPNDSPSASAGGKWYYLTILEHKLSYPGNFAALINRAFRFLPSTAALVRQR